MVRPINVSGDKALSSISCRYQLAPVHLPSCYHGSSERKQFDNGSFISVGGGVCHLGEVGRYERRHRRHIKMKRYLTDGVSQLIGILMDAAAAGPRYL